MNGPLALCTFALDGRAFGIAVESVAEVLRRPELRNLPLSPPSLCGLFHLRGQILPAVDLRHCLGKAPSGSGEVLVVRGEEGPIGLLVDEVRDVIQVDWSRCEPAPAPETHAASGGPPAPIRAVVKLPEGLLAVLDLPTLLAHAFGLPLGTNEGLLGPLSGEGTVP